MKGEGSGKGRGKGGVYGSEKSLPRTGSTFVCSSIAGEIVFFYVGI